MELMFVIGISIDLLIGFVYTISGLYAGQDGGKRMGLKFDRIKYVSSHLFFSF